MTEITLKPILDITPEMLALFDQCLGPGRFSRTAYRVREQATIEGFGFNGFKNDKLVGTISLTPITIGATAGACLIGPLLVLADYRSKGLGQQLIERAIEAAKDQGMKIALLVGDAAYYKRSGFKVIPPHQISMPGPVAPGRLLIREITKGSTTHYHGKIAAI